MVITLAERKPTLRMRRTRLPSSRSSLLSSGDVNLTFNKACPPGNWLGPSKLVA